MVPNLINVKSAFQGTIFQKIKFAYHQFNAIKKKIVFFVLKNIICQVIKHAFYVIIYQIIVINVTKKILQLVLNVKMVTI